jgi:hypothetical protein
MLQNAPPTSPAFDAEVVFYEGGGGQQGAAGRRRLKSVFLSLAVALCRPLSNQLKIGSHKKNEKKQGRVACDTHTPSVVVVENVRGL